MEQKGWDQKALAKATDLSESAVSRHLDGASPRADSIQKYAQALGVGVAWLGYGHMDAPAVPSTQRPDVIGRDVTGLDALALVLRDFRWPEDVDMIAIDSAESEARRTASTSVGQSRSPSAWRAYLDRLVRRKSDKQVRNRA